MKQDESTVCDMISDTREDTMQCEEWGKPIFCEVFGVEDMEGVEEGVDDGVADTNGETFAGSGVLLGSWLNSDSEDTSSLTLILTDQCSIPIYYEPEQLNIKTQPSDINCVYLIVSYMLYTIQSPVHSAQ